MIESEEESHTERIIFEEDFHDSGMQPIVVGNDLGKPKGRPTDVERHYKIQGL